MLTILSCLAIFTLVRMAIKNHANKLGRQKS